MTKKVKGPFPSDDFLATPVVHVGRKIKEARLAAGVSLNELARRTGMDRTQISRYEQAVHPVTLDRLQRIAEALDVTILWFLSDGAVPPDWLEQVGDDHKLGALNWLRAYINPKVPEAARKGALEMLAAFG